MTFPTKGKEAKLGETDRFSSHLKPLANVVNWATHGRLGVQVLRGDWSETRLLTLSQAPREKAGGQQEPVCTKSQLLVRVVLRASPDASKGQSLGRPSL